MTVNLKRAYESGLKVLLVGGPGCGKTERNHEVIKELGWKMHVMRCSLMERPDVGGCFVPDFQKSVTRQLPLEALKSLRETKEKTFLFLDDLGQAPVDVQASIMSFFDSGYFPPNILIGGATNRPGDKAGVMALCEPLRSRFDLAFTMPSPDATDDPINGSQLLSTWQDEVENWCSWAVSVEAPAEVIAFHRSTAGKWLYQWKPCADPAARMPDYRTWGTVIRLLKAGITDQSMHNGCIGKAAATTFLAFRQLASKIPTPDQVRQNPAKAILPTEDDPAALYMTSSILAMAAKPADAKPFVQYMVRMPRMFVALMARDMNRRIGQALSLDPTWIKWWRDNQDLFLS